ncbi:MAG: hypothetical protein K6E50_15130 [Lachnospiraceae bacterium]|nr:hypothetical protein [Lachnospiraceae bacterium]
MEIIHLLYAFGVTGFALTLFFLLLFILLAALRKKYLPDKKKAAAWKAFCFLPLLIALLHCILFAAGPMFLHILPFYLPIYIPALLIALYPLLSVKKPLRLACTPLVFTACLVCSFLSLYSDRISDYSDQSLSKAYLSLCDLFERSYILSDWKKTDYNRLREEGLALIRNSEQSGDLTDYYRALDLFVESFHDGHMDLTIYDKPEYFMDKYKSFHDYGLSLLTLDDGTTIAVNVDEGLPIKEGDIITRWNGVPVDEAAAAVAPPFTTPLTENEKILKMFFLAGTGEESVTVTYLNPDGEELSIELERSERPLSRASQSLNLFTHSYYEEDFAEYKMLNADTAYLAVEIEEIDPLSDALGYVTGDHKAAREKYRSILRGLRNEGMRKLVIDARNNSGGYDEVATALASLFTREKIYAFSLGCMDGHSPKNLTDHYVLPDGEFSDIKVLVLTNMGCSSAGDGLVLYLSRIDGITVAGLSDPEGINQETGGRAYLPGGVEICYPVGLILDADGNPNIDCDDTRMSRNSVDIKIPLDREAALKIFRREDYELEWAVETLKKSG